MVQRMRELTVQAVNSTNTSSDLSAINQEYSQLGSEIQRTVSSVEFNGQSLLNATTDFNFQIGANSAQTITVSASQMNVATADVSALFGAGAASAITTAAGAASGNLSALDAALTAINSTRANLGAVQSRFTNTINFLQSAAENQAAAKGRIMDADFASETSNLSRAQILQQAGTAMIAQANQLPQGVLALLR
jgi:flagellin